MRIAILSDIHDNVWNLAAALEGVKNTDAMIVCGDLCSPFVIAQMANEFPGPIHIVFGNNDGDLYRITNVGAKYSNVHLHGEYFQGEMGGKLFAANHYQDIALALSESEKYDVVCYGHNHIYKTETVGRTLAINPGTVMGYDPVHKTEVPATLVIYDTAISQASGYRVVRGTSGSKGKILPHEG
ncbi:MAG TPA: YfcE family phosphodiesterase [Anaerolineales bacterium]|jgi:putative phosphoesterase|nr:YfcE family phosphodiesterase [Anaerolineales bacterium]